MFISASCESTQIAFSNGMEEYTVIQSNDEIPYSNEKDCIIATHIDVKES